MNSKSGNLLRLASILSFINAAVIMGIKSYGWIVTDSVAVLASFLDAILDILAALVNLIAIRLALSPPDNKHRFGHDKFQDLAVFAQSIFFGVSGLFIIFSSIKKFSHKVELEHYEVGVFIMITSIILNLCLMLFQTYVIKVTNSQIIKADRLHYSADFFTNIAVVISLQISHSFKFDYVDPIFAILIALYIMYGSYQLFTKAIHNLIDAELDDKERSKILKIIAGFAEIKGLHELKTRYAGNKLFIQCHLEMAGTMTLYRAHELTHDIMAKISESFPESEIIIHQDPAGLEGDVKFKENLPR